MSSINRTKQKPSGTFENKRNKCKHPDKGQIWKGKIWKRHFCKRNMWKGTILENNISVRKIWKRNHLGNLEKDNYEKCILKKDNYVNANFENKQFWTGNPKREHLEKGNPKKGTSANEKLEKRKIETDQDGQYVVEFGLADARGEKMLAICSHFASHHAPNATRPRQTVCR